MLDIDSEGLLILGLFNIESEHFPLLLVLISSFLLCVFFKVAFLVRLYDRPRGIKYRKIAETFFSHPRSYLNEGDDVEKCILYFISHKGTTMGIGECSGFPKQPKEKNWWRKEVDY